MKLFGFIFSLFFGLTAFAGVQVYNGVTNLKVFDTIQCSTGLTCAKSGNKAQLTANPTAQGFTTFGPWSPSTLSSGTSVSAANSTTVYLSQLFIPVNTVITGLAIENAGTVGTNKWYLALLNSSGVVVAHTSTGGVLSAGTSAYQRIALTSSYSAVAGAYWIGFMADGSHDSYYSLPAAASGVTIAGTSTGQVYGALSTVVLPTTFSAGVGPISFTY